jgi:uncharacterized C2H2 Zn-finger protein
MNKINNFKCNLCSHIFTTKQSLEKHIDKKLKCNEATEFQCKKCNRYFQQKKNLVEHTEKKRCDIVIQIEESIKKPIQTPILHYKNIKNVLNLDTPIENKYKLLKLINNDLTLENLIEILNYKLPIEDTINFILLSKKDNLDEKKQNQEIILNKSPFINEKVNYIYLIQERENYEQNKNIFKFGKTSQKADTRIERLQKYKKGSKVLMFIECEENLLETENKIRDEFKKEFIQHKDGHEHFEGDPKRMKKIINSIVYKN